MISVACSAVRVLEDVTKRDVADMIMLHHHAVNLDTETGKASGNVGVKGGDGLGLAQRTMVSPGPSPPVMCPSTKYPGRMSAGFSGRISARYSGRMFV